MIPNLLFYSSSIGLGFLFSLYFWGKEERSKSMIVSAILIPVLWTIILAIGKGTFDFRELYDVRLMSYSFHRNRVTFWLIPMLETTILFGTIWIERNRARAMAIEGKTGN